MKKIKLIIDTDPGVDDTLCLIFALHDPRLDVKLLTICPGNVNSDIGTRNMCHLLDLFHKDIPVVQGAKTAYKRVSPDASFLHGKEGLGAYIPPKKTIHQPIKEDCSDAMYKVLKENPHEVTILAIGPHTNIAHLFEKHPDAKDLIKQIVFEGNAPFGVTGYPDYNSFNCRTDPESQNIVLSSGLPIIMVTSEIGRFQAHFTEEQIDQFTEINDITRFLNLACQVYWTPEAPDKRIATNDTCALFSIEYPWLFKTKKGFVSINETDNPGKSTATFNRKGNVKIIMQVNRKKFQKMIYKRLHELDSVKLDPSIYDLTRKAEAKKAAEAKKVEKQTKTTKSASKKKTTSKKATSAPTKLTSKKKA